MASRSKKRPAFRPHERGLLVFLSSIMRRWRDALLLVKADTIIRWHREVCRLSWKTFLKNHTVWACDFLQLYDIWFRPIFAFFIMNVNTKEVVHWAVTRAPTEQWTAPSPCCRLHFVQTNMGPNCAKRPRSAPRPKY